jgi:hypothetical protein
MTLLDTVRGRVATKAPLPTDLKKELSAAEGRIAELESQHGAAALDTFAQEPGAQGRLDDLTRQLAAGRERVQTLRAAHRTALEREEAATLAQRAALQAAQRKAAIKHLHARDEAAAACGAALEEAAKQYRIVLERSEKAQAACPILTQWPDGNLCGLSDIRRLVTGEMYRVSATSSRDDRALPGAHFPSIETEWNPKAIVPLADQMKAASAWIISRLIGKGSTE